jgi:Phage tail tube protein
VTVEIGGIGTFGIGFETTYGTFVAPTKWIPIRSESLQRIEERQYRENIRGLADRQNPIQGYTRIEGDVRFEVTRDNLVYFLYGSRVDPTHILTGSDHHYTFTPANVTFPTTASGFTARKTLSLYVVRAENVFRYTGCNITQIEFSFDNSVLMCTARIIGIEEDETSVLTGTPTWVVAQPYSAGQDTIAVGTATPTARADIDTVTLTINDNGTAEQRIKAGTGPAFIKWGERETTAAFDYDFNTRTDYDAFRNQTEYQIILKGTHEATPTNDTLIVKYNSFALDSHEVGLSSIGDLVRARVNGHGFYDTGATYQIDLFTNVDVTA